MLNVTNENHETSLIRLIQVSKPIAEALSAYLQGNSRYTQKRRIENVK